MCWPGSLKISLKYNFVICVQCYSRNVSQSEWILFLIKFHAIVKFVIANLDLTSRYKKELVAEKLLQKRMLNIFKKFS